MFIKRAIDRDLSRKMAQRFIFGYLLIRLGRAGPDRDWITARTQCTCALLLATALALTSGQSARAEGPPVLTYHAHADRNGHFVVPTLSWERARSLHLDQ